MDSPYEFIHNRPNINHIMITKSDNDLKVLLFNKPFQVLCQFSDHEAKITLAHHIRQSGIYPAGRLDYDSEGLLLLTGNGQLQHLLTDPKHKLPKTYWVQVEGVVSDAAIAQLVSGVELKDGLTRPAICNRFEPPPDLWERRPPVRYRENIPTSWISLTLTEGRNRQVRRMTAAAGFPTLRLIRAAIGPWSIAGIQPGESCWSGIPAEIAQQLRTSAVPDIRSQHNKRSKRGKSVYQRSRAR